MQVLNRLIVAALCVTPAAQTAASEFEAGAYHDENCTRCHDTGVYTRADRKVRSYPKLQAQVARCDSMLQTRLFPDDLAMLVEHLNDNFYRFSK